MKEEYFINLGGRERVLEYRLEDRIELESLFPRPNGHPGSIVELLGHLTATGSVLVQISLAWAGVRHEDPKGRIDRKTVMKWFSERYSEGLTPEQVQDEVFKPILKAIAASGVCGPGVKIDLEPYDASKEGEPEAPKDRGLKVVKAADGY